MNTEELSWCITSKSGVKEETSQADCHGHLSEKGDTSPGRPLAGPSGGVPEEGPVVPETAAPRVMLPRPTFGGVQCGGVGADTGIDGPDPG